MTRLAWLLVGTVVARALSEHAGGLQENACARLTRAEASAVLSAAVGEGRVTVQDLATECSYETVGNESRRQVLTFSVYETGRAGLRGSAADYFTEVRRTSMHMGLRMQSVAVGDEAYWMGGVLHVRKGQDLSFAIEIVGATAEPAGADTERNLALSTKVAAILVDKLDAPTTTRETLTIATNTQAHRKDIQIAVGNIWEESYTPESGPPQTGLTAMLFMGVPEDASQRQRVRVYPSQVLRVFGYIVQIVSIERSGVRLTLERESREH